MQGVKLEPGLEGTAGITTTAAHPEQLLHVKREAEQQLGAVLKRVKQEIGIERNC